MVKFLSVRHKKTFYAKCGWARRGVIASPITQFITRYTRRPKGEGAPLTAPDGPLKNRLAFRFAYPIFLMTGKGCCPVRSEKTDSARLPIIRRTSAGRGALGGATSACRVFSPRTRSGAFSERSGGIVKDHEDGTKMMTRALSRTVTTPPR